jgi:hypothetical protein
MTSSSASTAISIKNYRIKRSIMIISNGPEDTMGPIGETA